MTKQKRTDVDDAEQSKRFIDKAREIEADETEEGATKAFQKVAKNRPSKPVSGKGDRS